MPVTTSAVLARSPEKVLATWVRAESLPMKLLFQIGQASAATLSRIAHRVFAASAPTSASFDTPQVARTYAVTTSPTAARIIRQAQTVRAATQAQSVSVAPAKAKFVNLAATVVDIATIGRALPRTLLTGFGAALPATFISESPLAQFAYTLSGKVLNLAAASAPAVLANRLVNPTAKQAQTSPVAARTLTPGRVLVASSRPQVVQMVRAAQLVKAAASATAATLGNLFSITWTTDPVVTVATLLSAKVQALLGLAASQPSSAAVQNQGQPVYAATQDQDAELDNLPAKTLPMDAPPVTAAQLDQLPAITWQISSTSMPTLSAMTTRLFTAASASAATVVRAAVRARAFAARSGQTVSIAKGLSLPILASAAAETATLARTPATVWQTSSAPAATRSAAVARIYTSATAAAATLTATVTRVRAFLAATAARVSIAKSWPKPPMTTSSTPAPATLRQTDKTLPAGQGSAASIASLFTRAAAFAAASTPAALIAKLWRHSPFAATQPSSAALRTLKLLAPFVAAAQQTRAIFVTDHPAVYRFLRTGEALISEAGRIAESVAGRVETFIERLK